MENNYKNDNYQGNNQQDSGRHNNLEKDKPEDDKEDDKQDKQKVPSKHLAKGGKRFTSKKSLIIIAAVVLLILIILALLFWPSGKKTVIIDSSNSSANFNNEQTIVNEGSNEQQSTEIGGDVTNLETVNQPGTITENLGTMTVPVVEENLRMSLPVPAQSRVMTEEAIPAGAIKISGTETGFSPKEFTVKPGEEITLALTSKISLPVILTFYNNAMPATSIGCGPGETRWVSFKTPTKAGEYIFKNDVIGHSAETGRMIVK
jgi:plastocyanin